MQAAWFRAGSTAARAVPRRSGVRPIPAPANDAARSRSRRLVSDGPKSECDMLTLSLSCERGGGKKHQRARDADLCAELQPRLAGEGAPITGVEESTQIGNERQPERGLAPLFIERPNAAEMGDVPREAVAKTERTLFEENDRFAALPTRRRDAAKFIENGWRDGRREASGQICQRLRVSERSCWRGAQCRSERANRRAGWN